MVDQPAPPMWNMGRFTRSTESDEMPHSGEQMRLRSKNPWFESIAPLGAPVVPDVYSTKTVVVGSGLTSGVGGCLAVPPLLEVLVACVAPHHEDLGDALQFPFDLVDHRHIFLADDDQLALGVVDHVKDLARSQAPVDAGVDHIDFRRPIEVVEELQAVLVEEPDVILGTDAFGEETVGDAVRPLVQLRVG